MAVTYIRSDLEFILQQILIAEAHAAGADLTTLVPNAFVPFGLRTVDGSFNNLFPGNEDFGAADQLFPRLTDPVFGNDQDGDTIDINGPAPGGVLTNTDYGASGNVVDADPRIISNLIADQTSNNPAAVAIAGSAGADGIWGTADDQLNDGVSIIRVTAGADGVAATADDIAQFSFDNVASDEGLSAPFNQWFVFFGQFFDHGLDLLQKGGNGFVFIPLQADDPLVTLGPDGAAGTGDEAQPGQQFMVLTRATTFVGPDGTVEHLNQTSPFVDQNQTYSSHPSHQVFLRAYERRVVDDPDGTPNSGDEVFQPVATGALLTNRDLGADGVFGSPDDADLGGMSTWATLKAQARDLLGINLTDADVGNVPLLATDAYGNFIRGPNGFPQVVMVGPDGDPGTADDVLVEGNPAAPIDLTNAVRTGQMFLADIAHSANPFDSQTGALLAADDDRLDFNNDGVVDDADLVDGAGVIVDADGDGDIDLDDLADVNLDGTINAADFIGDDGDPATYDNELLDQHFMAGDGRVNENIGLTAVHHVFHSEHNRLVEHTKDVALSTGDVAFLNQWLDADAQLTIFPASQAEIDALQWNGERLFQAAKLGTEMQYQHLVFEEFARKIQPNVDEFLAPEGFATQLNPAILAEFAHVVYRFGHSMLLDNIDRLDPSFASSEIGLIEAFLNPLAFNEGGTLSAEEAAGAIVRGTTRQVGNEIDEFKTEALRNNLLGLPLDLASINLARARDTGIPSLNAARREFHELTQDSQLKAYESWIDFMQGIEHPESLVNFIAAYGTHATITAQTTLAGKRAAAMAIVLGVQQVIDPDGIPGNADDIVFAPPADSLDFLNGTGAYANVDGVTVTGVDNIDFWIGGLAERIMPFGGMLGSTFNFVFETQLEALQNGDRLYYLARLAGLNFLTELENNSFAKLIMANTNATHLPADVFSTPSFILEVNQSQQFTGLGLDGRADPTHEDTTGLNALNPLVIRDNPATSGSDTNYLEYTGVDHVVLGGTEGNDILIASIGDDTLWGDGGNDRLEGGDGNDNIEGGDGHDIITDRGGDDVLKGNGGNDVIQGGNGFNLIIAGSGNDFIITGEDVSETFGGTGNDFILGSQMNLPTFGNEGDDWIEIGTSDGAGGDNFDPQEASPVVGHDVFITGGGFDEVDGEGGDDVMVASDGEDHFGGGGGFDWGSYEHDPFGVKADLEVNDFIEPPVAPSNQGLQDRFVEVEGLSGSAFSDILRGSEANAAQIDVEGTLNSALTAEGIARIGGLQQVLDQLVGPGTTRFAAGNIILGGGGSDILEGRGGDDLIDGDKALNVRVSVRQTFDPVTGQPTGAEIATFESIADPILLQNMLNGVWNPGQLMIVREILNGGADFDTATFSGTQDQYTVVIDNGADGTSGTSDDVVTVIDSVAGRDGVDRLANVERLQFSDSARVLVEGLNEEPVGAATIDGTAAIGQELIASVDLVTDADNPGGAITGPVAFFWQVERDAAGAPGVFEDIVDAAGGNPATAAGASFTVPADLAGLSLRVKAVYQDANGVLETVFSAPTAAVAAGTPPAPAPILPDGSNVASEGVHLITSDLQFILDQIKIAEQHAAGADILDLIANSRLPFGLRTVDGSLNNLVQGQTELGAADNTFPRLLDPFFINADFNTSYTQDNGTVIDAEPRIISNLVADQTSNNPAAVAVAGSAGADLVWGTADDALNDGVTIIGRKVGADLAPNTADDIVFFSFENVTPDEGLSAPFNLWFVFFGQFFDHGLDLVAKNPESGIVFIPLQPDDPLVAGADGAFNTADDLPQALRFMVLTRAENQAGPDGTVGTADDIHEHTNLTTPFVDQNQTYTSTPSHQVFLREYEMRQVADPDGIPNSGDEVSQPFATGRLITNRAINPDGTLGADLGGMSTWAVVKAQARDMLGIQLTDYDAGNVPLIKVDAYGNFIPDPATGFAQIIVGLGADGIAQTADDLVQAASPNDNGGLGTLVPITAPRTGHPFLADIAHTAFPFNTQTGAPLTPDADDVVNTGPQAAGFYDDELLDEHFMAGDGRVNENIGLTAVHHVFHAEHNRLVGHIKDVILASAAEGDLSFLNEWLVDDVTTVPADLNTLVWDGERLFQAARFGTEMQYQHLVFEEFARKIQPQVDVFLQEGQGYDSTIDAAIVAEFAHVVYRFGHSMLLDEIDRFSPEFASSEIGLIEAFLNPTAFDASGTLSAEEAAGAIVRGTTRQVGNEIDEFKTEALRNNLLGLPLDLASINLARGRDTGIPSLNAARATFHEWTGDSQLTPYASWVDFMQNLRHPESLVNFIAAYGTHSTITSQTTLAGKRAAALAIVLGTAGAPLDRLDFLNATGAWAGGSLGGLNDVDFWIGGLAEKQMPFGGLLGSTFNYVFENQLEKLQNGDRFYYLERTAALNFLTELENNSFAKLIMANTDATHLPGDVFSTPAFVLEVDQTRQFNERTGVFLPGLDGIPGTADDIENTNADPIDESNPLNPLVIRDNPTDVDNPATTFFNEAGTNYLEYTGGDHVVLGGTEANDILIGSIGDDTLYGDGGHDRLEGGDGVDMILGGDGDDIITDMSLEDNLQGGNGNDAINGGNSVDLILGGFGNDFIVTGEDGDESFGGPGNDFILGDVADEMVFGNEGDDWIEGGMADGSAGENFDTRGLDLIVGNDVFIDSMFPDRMNGEGGDDIMVGSQGGQVDRFIGGSGFDWASFQGDQLAADVDLNLRAFDETPVPLSIASSLSRFESAEGLSGSARSDILRGDDADATTIPFSGAQGSALTNFGLINGLSALFVEMLGAVPASFSAGNIILGGSGSDLIEGRGGDDLIDGDRSLNVRISVRGTVDGNGDGVADRDANGSLILGDEIESVTSMTELVDRVFSGEINPGQLQIVREIVDNGGFSFDTAQFSDVRANYDIAVNGDVVTVTHLVGGAPGIDGTDTLRSIERLQFADQAVVLQGGLNAEPQGELEILDANGDPVGTPVEGQQLTVSIENVSDADNTGGDITGPISYVWQFEARAGSGVFEDIVIATGLGDLRATGTTLVVPPDVAGSAIRVKAVYEDQHGVIETVFSDPTAPVQGLNDPATGAPTISDTTPLEGFALTAITATIVDPNGTDDASAGGLFTFRWQQSADGSTWGDATNPNAFPPDDGTGQLFVPGQSQVGMLLRVVVTFVDDGGNTEVVTSAATEPVVDDTLTGTEEADVLTDLVGFGRTIVGLGGNDIISGLDGVDIILGGLGDDDIDGGAGDDFISGDEGNDTIRGGAGNDFIDADFGFGDIGDDFIDGGAGADVMQAGDGNDTFVVDDLGDTVSDFGLEGIDTIRTTLGALSLESVTAVENLTYTGTGNFTGTGNEFDNTITGGSGNDTLGGLLGNDTLVGGAGADVMTGGAGNDSYVVDNVGDQVIELPGEGTDTVQTSLAAYALGADVENVTFAGTGNFTATGNGLNNAIAGGSGNDTLNGAAGADVMTGGAGNDSYVVDNAGDQAVEAANGGSDSVHTALGTYALGANVENLLYAGTGSFTGVGNDLGNFMIGGGGSDVLLGALGNDVLGGGGGTDYLDGGDGADYLDGGAANDVLGGGAGNDTLGGGGGADYLDGHDGADYMDGGADNDVMGGSAGNDVLLGSGGADWLDGGAGADWIEGGDGNDVFAGGADNDVIIGGTGADYMTGNSGNDVFVFSPGFANDVVTDFDADSAGGQDFLNLKGTGINAANFAANVSIVDLGADTLVTVNTSTIYLMGVNGVGGNTVTQQDFFFA